MGAQALVGLCVKEALGPAALVHPTTKDVFGREIAWNSAPELRRRVRLGHAGLGVRVEARDGVPFILTGKHERGRLVVVAADIEDEENAAFHRWGYGAYLLRVLVAEAAGEAPPNFATWEPAPVPHGRAFLLWGVTGLVLWVLALLGYAWARRAGRDDPEAAMRFMAAVAEMGSKGRRAASGGEAPHGDGASWGKPEPTDAAARDRAWNRVGFSRPLSAFLLFQSILLVGLAPYILLLTVVMGNYVQPFPEAEGLWRPLLEAAMFFWALFDMGTQTAFVKYFAEFRTSDAREAVRCVQFYFWWQVFSRLAQLTLVLILAAYIPRTQYALFSHFLAVYGLVQLPGLVVGVKFVIQAVQRFDLQLTLDLVEQRIAMYLVPIPFVFLFRAWGKAHPEYGEAFGAALGLAMGPQAAAFLVAGLGLYFLKGKLGLPLRPLLLAQFDRTTARRLLVYGFKATLGQEPYRIANVIENGIIVARLASYQTWLGLRNVLANVTQYVVLFGWSFFVSAVPALSEAYAAGKQRLCQYYIARYLQFAHLFVAVIAGLVGAIGAPLIRDVMAPQWARAGDYVLLAVAVLVFLPFAWISDMLQQGSGRTGLNAIVVCIEQVIRIGLFWLLIPTFQFPGMYLAILGTLALKCVIAWTCNHFLIVRLRLFLWQMVGAPALVGFALYGLLKVLLVSGFFAGFVPVIGLFIAATPFSILLGFFLLGLFGGLDEAAVTELDEAATMSLMLRRLSRVLAKAAILGHRLSPLGGRFPITIAEEARREALELEAAARAASATTCQPPG